MRSVSVNILLLRIIDRRLIVLPLFFICVLLLSHGVLSQSYPNQAIRAVVGYSAGGGADGVIRLLAPAFSELMKQPMVIDNRPGGGTVIATQVVANAKPDGYTVLVGDNAFIVNPYLINKLPYDSMHDFLPVIALEASSSTLLVCHPSLPIKSIQDLITLAKAKPGQIYYASGGNGTVPHIMGALFKYEAKIDWGHVPYKSTGLAVYATMSGEVPLGLGGIFAVKSLVDSARLRALALASQERSALMPQVATFKELGWPTIDATAYRGLLVPAGTPREVVLQLNMLANKALQMASVKAHMAEVGYRILGGSPEDYGRIIQVEMKKWASIIQRAHIKID
jgi:hypothetical protein